MLVIYRGRWEQGIPQKGTWWPGLACSGNSAVISCPICGKIGTLSDHAIDSQGKVTPSVVCPREQCKFHDFVVLEGWRDE
jgi:hypothetical protein